MTLTDTDADRALKTRHRAMWASGDYPSVVTEVIHDLGPRLVQATKIRRGDTVLDVAAGSGNVAIPAALTGADVIASDLAPELFEAGRAEAARAGAALRWEQGDAEHLPYADASFDVVTSCVGVMFAPRHQRSADELVRVLRPGGTLGLISWTPQGFIGRLFATMKPYVPPAPQGASPPPLWGDEEHVRTLLGDRVKDVVSVRHTLPVGRFPAAEDFRDFFRDRYGPTIAAYRNVSGDPERAAALDRDLLAFAAAAVEDGSMAAWEYLLVTATRA